MKYKLVIVIVLGVLLLAGGIIECIYIKNTMEDLIEQIDEIIAEDPMDKDKVYETGRWMEEKHKRLEFIIPHFELNQLSIDYKEIIAAIEKEDFDQAYMLFHRVREYAERLGDIYRFRYQNIV